MIGVKTLICIGLNQMSLFNTFSAIAASQGPALYNRKFQILVYDTNGGPVFDSQQKNFNSNINETGLISTGISNNDNRFPGIDVSDLRCTFEIEKQLSPIQISTITIYNLAPNTETNILFNATNVALSAGYQDQPYGQIFTGRIIQKIRGKDDDGVTYFLRLVCMDGDDQLQTNFVTWPWERDKTKNSRQNLLPVVLMSPLNQRSISRKRKLKTKAKEVKPYLVSQEIILEALH
jgi:hypothetical protein